MRVRFAVVAAPLMDDLTVSIVLEKAVGYSIEGRHFDSDFAADPKTACCMRS